MRRKSGARGGGEFVTRNGENMGACVTENPTIWVLQHSLTEGYGEERGNAEVWQSPPESRDPHVLLASVEGRLVDILIWQTRVPHVSHGGQHQN